jgi:hypothetical protein
MSKVGFRAGQKVRIDERIYPNAYFGVRREYKGKDEITVGKLSVNLNKPMYMLNTETNKHLPLSKMQRAVLVLLSVSYNKKKLSMQNIIDFVYVNPDKIPENVMIVMYLLFKKLREKLFQLFGDDVEILKTKTLTPLYYLNINN